MMSPWTSASKASRIIAIVQASQASQQAVPGNQFIAGFRPVANGVCFQLRATKEFFHFDHVAKIIRDRRVDIRKPKGVVRPDDVFRSHTAFILANHDRKTDAAATDSNHSGFIKKKGGWL